MALADDASALPARPVAATLEWGRAIRALRRLLNDNEDTVQVFEIMRALNGSANARAYHRLLATTEGGRIAYERAELGDKLMDMHRALMANNQSAELLLAQGLAEIARAAAPRR